MNIHEKLSFNSAIEIATHNLVGKHHSYTIVPTQFGRIFIDTNMSPKRGDPTEKMFYVTGWENASPNERTMNFLRDTNIDYYLMIPRFISSKLTKVVLAQAFAEIVLYKITGNRECTGELRNIVMMLWVKGFAAYAITPQALATRLVHSMYPLSGRMGMHDRMIPVVRHTIDKMIKEDADKYSEIVKVLDGTPDVRYWNFLSDDRTLDDEFDAKVAELIFSYKVTEIGMDLTKPVENKHRIKELIRWLDRRISALEPDEKKVNQQVPGIIAILQAKKGALEKLIEKPENTENKGEQQSAE